MNRRGFLLSGLGAVLVACGSSNGTDPAPSGTSDAAPGDGGTVGTDAGPPPKPVSPTSDPAQSDTHFPQGLCSGDPRPDRVILWTRIDPKAAGKAATDDIEVEFIVAADEALTKIVGRGTATALASADHTLRVIPTGLDSGRHYYYRFESGDTTTRVARTKTAPAPTADVTVKFAMAACQDYVGRYYHSWQALLDEQPDLDFVMFLGDYIYETVNDERFQSTAGERAVFLQNPLDTSAAQDRSRLSAGTLEDYRICYKTYRSDPVLREVHRLYPFILTWDDHEFADDCWQDHSTSFNELDPVTKGFTSEQNTPRRVAANRAFFEYQPMDVQYDASKSFPNEITIYRKLNWGKHVDIFMTDQRMYRADHLIPEGPRDLQVGKTSANSMIGSRYFVRKSAFDPREAAAKPTLLGAAQKAWVLDEMKKSTATWKVWGNEVQMYQMALKLGDLPGVPSLISYTAYINCDQWDGYRSERQEILGELERANVQNLLVCTGDIHSFWAAELHTDFDQPTAKPVGVEYVTAGISSSSLNALVDNLIPPGSVLSPVASAFARGAGPALLAENRHLHYADTNSYGFAVVEVDAQKTQVEFVHMNDPKGKAYAPPVSRQKFVTLVGTNKIVTL